MDLLLLAFWFSFGACLYLYIGYPALVLVLARLRPRRVHRARVRPTVTVIIPAFNEEEVIGRKILNTLGLYYPPGRLEAVVVSDGSTDGTDEIVRRHEGPSLRLLSGPRLGKAEALNRGAAAARGEILVFTDANTLLEKDALIRLVENFGDPTVGGVCGNKRYRTPAGADASPRGEGLYWRFDTWQKRCESRAGSIFAADGALYAVRRSLYVPIRDPAQADDIAISARVVLQGLRLVFEPGAVAFEDAPSDARAEFRRKVRVTNHSLRALLDLRGRLWTSGFYSVQLLSHKFFRHLAPLFLLALLGSSAALAPAHAGFAAMLGLQLAFYTLAVVGFALRKQRVGRRRALALPAYFGVIHLAALGGLLTMLGGRRHQLWTPRGGGYAAPATGRVAVQ